jgi:hypothetical protein
VPLCPLLIVTEGFAALRTSELPLTVVIVHSLSMINTDMASRDKGSLTVIWQLALDE